MLNAGVCGYGTDQELLLLRRLKPEVRPDAVVVVFCVNDPLESISRLAYGRAKPWFEVVGGRLELRGSPSPESWLERASHAWRAFERRRSDRVARRLQRDMRAEWKLTRALFLAMQRELDSVPLFIASSEEALAGLARDEAGLHHIHLEHVLAPLGEARRFAHDPHWTSTAHAAVAEALHRALSERLP